MEKAAAATAVGDASALIALAPALRFHGGGHLNHSIFWENLAPAGRGGGGAPTGALAAAIDSRFGSFAAFKAGLSASAAGVQGSGWAWLGVKGGRLELAACANQDPLEATTGLVPLLGFDVWEHAYYLQYKNVRPDYVGALWNVVNWADVGKRFAAAGGK